MKLYKESALRRVMKELAGQGHPTLKGYRETPEWVWGGKLKLFLEINLL